MKKVMKFCSLSISFRTLQFFVFPGKSESKDSPDKEKSDPPKAKPVKTPSKGGMYA
jgi:hypothetical protein